MFGNKLTGIFISIPAEVLNETYLNRMLR